MKMISKLGGGALIAAMAMWAAGCSKSGAATTVTDTAVVANTPLSNTAAPVPSPPQSPEDKVPRINVEETKKLLSDAKAIIIDVRGTDTYKTAHIKGALDIPISKLESGDFKGLPKDKRIIAYCS